jgi:hypothetical protein
VKKIVAALFLLLSGSAAYAEPPSLFENMHKCTYFAAKVSTYTAYASVLPDDQLTEFEKLIQIDVDRVADMDGKKLLVTLANIAWHNKHDNPTNVGMAVYEDCVKHQGTST